MSDKKYIFILIILIFLCGFASFKQFENFGKFLPEIKFPKIELPEINVEEFLPSEMEGYKEFISPDGKLKLNYPASWIEIDKNSLKQILSQKETPFNEADILFFVYKYNFNDQSAAILGVGETNEKKEIDEIIKKEREIIVENNGDMEIINLEKENESATLEIKMKGKDGTFSRAKEKVIFGENKTYFIIIAALEKDWQKFENEANEILNSAKFNQ